MKSTSKTGLTASPIKKINRNEECKTIHLRAISKPAPFFLKPFAGLYNPYPYGCSLLCNHPTDNEAKDLLRKAKDIWATEGKNLLLAEEVDAIRTGLTHVSLNTEHHSPQIICIPQVESVPEELFRRYTDTDSRPLTPAPTLASAATRASGTRRCVTPDPLPTSKIREKTLLILDLRRSHSQETLSWYGSSSINEPPLIRIQHVSTRAVSLEDLDAGLQNSTKTLTAPLASKHQKKLDNANTQHKNDRSELGLDEGAEDEFVKRRGKRRRKRGRDASRGPPAFQVSLDPETQVAAIGINSHNPSARPSLAEYPLQDIQHVRQDVKNRNNTKPRKSLDIDSYLDVDILKQLRRELNEEIVDNELNSKRRKALEEAFKTIARNKIECDELIAIQKELKVPPVNTDLWITLPRTFSRSSASFDLPMDSRTLSTMTPLEYVQNNVSITSSRKLLYNCIFNTFKMEMDDDCDYERKLLGKMLPNCINLVMGKALTNEQMSYIKNLVGWVDEDIYNFKTCCGVFALCERLLAPQFCPQLPDRKMDPCQEIEAADFEGLCRKLEGRHVDRRLVEILTAIKTL